MPRKKRQPAGPPPKPAIPEQEKAILADLYRTLRKMYSKTRKGKPRVQ
jgi:hypothetical protein